MYYQGKDDVVRGVTLLHKRHTIDRPLQLVCPLEIVVLLNLDLSCVTRVCCLVFRHAHYRNRGEELNMAVS